MSVIYCHRCDSYTDLDFDVTPVVLKGTTEFVCWDCVNEDEVCEECGLVFRDVLEDHDDVCECKPKEQTNAD